MAKIREVLKGNKTTFEVDLGRVAGKRRRLFKPTERLAERTLKEQERKRKLLGNHWDELDFKSRWTTLEILEEMRDHGVTLTEVWETYQKTHLSHGKSIIEDAIDDFLDIKSEAGRRGRYMKEMSRALARFAQGREKRQLGSVGSGEIRSWIASFQGSAATRKTMQMRIKTFFAWAERQALIAKDPTTRLETIRIDQADPQILSVAECRRLIQSARAIDPDMLPYFALSLFSGVRPDECARLTKKDIDLERGQIVISGEASKTRNRRIITLLPPAERIFKKYTFGKFAVNFRRRRTAIKKHAKIKKWPNDVLRHTAASHFYNIYGMDEATKQLGHSASIMLKHYRQMISKEETEDWMNI
ncbi:MAG: hypothetical protein CMJ25_14580 [Phycisphaerae bacterium]|nr:hypothetical protein [Phycisphaerae bacterium]